MFRLLLVLFLHQPCRSAELAACSEDSQCPNDFYCESHAFTCRQCLQCELFHRSLPLSSTLCVKSIVECGPCLKGFNNDQESQDSLKDKCTISGVKQKQLIPIYVWIIITVCVSAIIYLVVHLLCKTRVLTKIIYSITCTAAQHTQEQPQGQTRNHVVPSAPYYLAGTSEDPYPRSHQLQMMSVTDTDHPPFYNLLYPPLESNPLLLDQDTSPKEPYKFKPIIPICPKDAYESMNHHSAVVFNRAIYDSNAPANTVPILDNGVTEDTQTSQTDGIIQTVISGDVGSSSDGQVAVIGQNGGTPTILDTASNISVIPPLNTSQLATELQSSPPTLSEYSRNVEVPVCTDNALVNQVTCTFSTSTTDQACPSTTYQVPSLAVKRILLCIKTVSVLSVGTQLPVDLNYFP